MMLLKNTAPGSPKLQDVLPQDDAASGPLNGRPGKKIMVVDDDPVMLKTLSFTLRSNGFKVVTATDGSEAIGRMREEEPDMMLVDVSFPDDIGLPNIGLGWDGFQITQWIRAMNRGLPTVIISGSDKPEYHQQATKVGAQAFLSKPIDSEMLLGAIEKALG